MASVPSQREGRGVEWVTKRVFVVLGGLFAFVFFFFFTLSKILLATKICQSGAR